MAGLNAFEFEDTRIVELRNSPSYRTKIEPGPPARHKLSPDRPANPLPDALPNSQIRADPKCNMQFYVPGVWAVA